MTKHKSISLLFSGIFCLSLSLLTGCTSLNLFNNDFLNTFMPFGQTSLDNIQGKGPVTIVLENLTIEAKHGENAMITIHYIDDKGVTQSFTPASLSAVPAVDPDDPNGPSPRQPFLSDGTTPNPKYDPSYKETIILESGVREIWVSGTVFRTKIEVKDETVDLGNQKSQQIKYTTAFVGDAGTIQQESFTAYQLPPVHLVESKHYKCGDVIVVGLLDQRARNGAVIPQGYEAEYVDVKSLSFPVTPTVGTRFAEDPNNALISREYQYPASYVLIPVALPNLAGVNGIGPVLEAYAAEYADQ